jgi:hypothetical protein
VLMRRRNVVGVADAEGGEGAAGTADRDTAGEVGLQLAGDLGTTALQTAEALLVLRALRVVGTACMQKRSWCRRLMEAALRTGSGDGVHVHVALCAYALAGAASITGVGDEGSHQGSVSRQRCCRLGMVCCEPLHACSLEQMYLLST